MGSDEAVYNNNNYNNNNNIIIISIIKNTHSRHSSIS